MNKKQLIQKLVAVGLCASIGFTAMMATGAEVTEAASSKSTAASSSVSSKAQSIISFGKKFMGTPYKFGAATNTTKVFDCSSFTKHIFGKYGVNLPRTAAQQSTVGKAVSKANLKAGDLVFFSSGSRANGKNVTHVGVYVGNGKIMHTYGSPGVTISDLNSGTWKRTYLKARRVL
ncbi:C40 family peptidase [Paenibacillus sp.]|jgi:cell wall-associated NlpC family hydrolase|uniref:C40 family peptidase n=1 Tax=Paenibacillus sp. TaxID=58172 RepID=UPI00281E8C27|nr:C40 family peptidase [Paenibacillus sp.]MDR0270856.1 C40 family peptidase [Paenibacillus sp.]